MNERKQTFFKPNFLERLVDTLLRPFPTQILIQTVDLRGGEFSCQFVRTPAPSSSDAAVNGEDVDRI